MNTNYAIPPDRLDGASRSLPDSLLRAPLPTLPFVDPRRVVELVDVSQSMGNPFGSHSRLDAAKLAVTAFALAAERGTVPVEVAVVAFSDAAATVLPLTDRGIARAVRRAVSGLRPLSGTSLEKGLQEAANVLRPFSGRGDLEVVVLSDGFSNPNEPIHGVKELRSMGCTISCVGIGDKPEEVHEALLRRIASRDKKGQPLYRFITDPEGLERHYEELGFGITR